MRKEIADDDWLFPPATTMRLSTSTATKRVCSQNRRGGGGGNPLAARGVGDAGGLVRDLGLRMAGLG